MEQYIPKSALVAEIERRIKEIDEIGTYLSPKGVLTNLLCLLDTLEVKQINYIDAFIKKSCNWLLNNLKNYSTNELGAEYLIEDFKKYMKGE